MDAAIVNDSDGPFSCDEVDALDECGVCTRQGWLQGLKEKATCKYLGVPYAKPPIGDARFTAPQAAAGWRGVRAAKSLSAACIQGSVENGVLEFTGSNTFDEDCLYLNVWTPATATSKSLPVMVYIHGGDYVAGSADTYSGRGLSEAGEMIVVTMNYRLGALGFFASPELDAERGNAPSGSDGIRDQQLALQWIHDNIEAFHGDPDNVTLFGNATGAAAVGIHLVSPTSRSLAHHFILESGVPTISVSGNMTPISRDAMHKRTANLVADLCPDVADVMKCLRKLPPAILATWTPANNDVGWRPVIEGKGGVLPKSPDDLIESGALNDGQVIVGTNKDEYGLFAFAESPVNSLADLQLRIKVNFPDAVDEIMAIYAPNAMTDSNDAYVSMMTDVTYRCATRNFARIVAAQNHDVYLYSFEQDAAWISDEIVYIFGIGYFIQSVTPPVVALANAMRGYWFDLARHGNPNSDNRTPWPKFTQTNDRHMTLVDPPVVARHLASEACDFWNAYLAQ